jgi:hypothetical protein
MAESSKKDPTKVHGDLGKGQAQEKMDEITEKGFRGEAVDPTPNEAYSVAGVTAGKATPETDPELAAEAAEAAGVNPEAKVESKD